MAAQSFYIYFEKKKKTKTKPSQQPTTLEEMKSRDNSRMETPASFHHPLTNLPVVTELIAILLALMGADEELQVVLLKDLPRHIRPKIAAATSHRIFSAALLRHGVTPEDV